MPICQLETSYPNSFFPEGFEDEFAKFYSKLVGRPIERIFVCIMPNRRIRIRDSSKDGVLLRMAGLNVYNESDDRRKYSLAVAQYLHQQLNIPLNRMVMDVRGIDITELAMLQPIY